MTAVVAGATSGLKVDPLLVWCAAVLEQEVGRRQPKIPPDVGEREDENPKPNRHALHTLADRRARPNHPAPEEREE